MLYRVASGSAAGFYCPNSSSQIACDSGTFCGGTGLTAASSIAWYVLHKENTASLYSFTHFTVCLRCFMCTAHPAHIAPPDHLLPTRATLDSFAPTRPPLLCAQPGFFVTQLVRLLFLARVYLASIACLAPRMQLATCARQVLIAPPARPRRPLRLALWIFLHCRRLQCNAK